MNKSIEEIIWPNDLMQALGLYLQFVLQTLDSLNISFDEQDHNPVQLAKSYLVGDVAETSIASATEVWWTYIDDHQWVREFSDPRALKARLALCLLVIKSEAPELGQTLSWFIEILEFLKIDSTPVLARMYKHFEFA
jgi:hypothetical protein